MTRSNASVYLAALLIALTAAPAPASERFVQPIGIEYATDRLAAACAARTSPACVEELGAAGRAAAQRLVALARYRPELATSLATRAADSGSPELRAAAADALAQPYATASATPILAELLDDPVAAVRAAALHALRGSNDESAQRLAHRADAFDRGNEAALTPDAVPPAPKLGVALPSDAVYLYFASDAADGRATYSTAEAPAKLLGALSKKGRGPFTPAQFRQEVESAGEDASSDDEADSEDGMPSADQMAKAMAMAEKMMGAMAANPNATPEQQAAALAQAAGHSALDPYLADGYDDSELFGDPRLFIVELAGGGEAAVAVYIDRALGRTGITIHHRPGLGG